MNRRRERGAVLVITAAALTTLLLFTSIAIDLGYQRVARRDMQALADVVALDMVRLVDGRTVAQIEADPNWLAARDASVSRNDDTQGDPPTVTPILGSLDPTTRTFTVMTDAQVPNAVKVVADTTSRRFFQRGEGQVSRSAIAGGDDATVDYQLGSFLAGLSPFQNGLLQKLLSRAFCPDDASGASCRAALDVLSYGGLATTRVNLGDLAASLGFASADQLLASDVSLKSLLALTAAALPAGAPPTAAVTLNGIAAQLTSATTVHLGDFISLEQGNGADAADAKVDLLGLITGSAFLIDGDNLVDLPGATVSIPGVASMRVSLKVIETVQYKFGARVDDPPLTTGQIQLDTTINVAGLNVLGLLDAGSGTIGVSVVVGGASAQVTAASCASPSNVSLRVTPQPLAVTLNENLNILGLSLLGLKLPLASIVVNNLKLPLSGTPGTGTFAYPTAFLPPVGTGSTQRLGSTTLGLSGLLGPSPVNVSLGVLGLPLGLGPVIALLQPIVNPLLADIDDLIVGPLSRALGMNLGGGDVGAIDLHCTGRVALAG